MAQTCKYKQYQDRCLIHLPIIDRDNMVSQAYKIANDKSTTSPSNNVIAHNHFNHISQVQEPHNQGLKFKSIDPSINIK